jgi:hypothetical protein
MLHGAGIFTIFTYIIGPFLNGNYSSTMEHMSMVKSQVTPFSPQAAMPAEERQTHRNLQVQRGPPGPGKGPFGGAPVVGIDS